MGEIGDSHYPQERRSLNVQIKDNISDEPHVQSTDEDLTKQAAGSRRTILGRGTGRIQERQKYCTTNPDTETNGRTSMAEASTNLQLLHRFQ